MLICKFCQSIRKSLMSLKCHERSCPLNKDRVYTNHKIGKSGGNQYTKGTAKELSLETRLKLATGGKNIIWDETKRKNHSDAMKKAVLENPESYTSSNRGRTNQIEKHGIKFQGKWELEFYEWCLSNSVIVERCNEWFPYEFDGTRKYNPDFYLPALDLYVEVKGYQTLKDEAKWDQFPKKLCIIKSAEIKKIRQNSFSGPLAQGLAAIDS